MRLIARKLIFSFLILSSMAGCTGFSTNPDLPLSSENNVLSIKTYSYRMDNLAVHQSKNYDITLQKISDATDLVLNDSKRIYYSLNEEYRDSSHLEINVVYNGSDQLCYGMFITAISLGLIPSWCTVEDIMTLHFKYYENGQFCKENKYSIDATQYNHLLLFPFSYVQGVYETKAGGGLLSGMVGTYEQTLESFIKTGCSIE